MEKNSSKQLFLWICNLGVVENKIIKKELNINENSDENDIIQGLYKLLSNGSVLCCILNIMTSCPLIDVIINTKSKLDAIKNFENFLYVVKNVVKIEIKDYKNMCYDINLKDIFEILIKASAVLSLKKFKLKLKLDINDFNKVNLY